MNVFRSNDRSLGWPAAAIFIASAAVCFHLGYLTTTLAPVHLAMLGYVVCLTQLGRLLTTRQSFYMGLVTGLFCAALQLAFFWNIFGRAAVVLWIILALWTAAFTGITRAMLTRFGSLKTAALIPFVWMGLEYFRSELYYLKFSWMNVGYALSGWEVIPFHIFGMYGVGFLAAICSSLFLAFHVRYALAGAGVLMALATLPFVASKPVSAPSQIHLAGMQMEFPNEHEIPAALDTLLAKYPDANVLVLSEYTLNASVPDSLKNWCRSRQRHLVLGGKDDAPDNNYYNTVFVVDPNGEIVFRQAKSVPIQFFKDGLPAPEQQVWNSPWGKIGFCVCYDLSYTRVIDGLVKKGAQLLIVPTMDVADWGEHQHQLHALVAPVRAAEYRIPIFRLASSGISQAVDADGRVLATAPFEGEGKDLFATLNLVPGGSMPLDRFLAPVAVGITAGLLLALCVRKPGSKSASVPVKTSKLVEAEKNDLPTAP